MTENKELVIDLGPEALDQIPPEKQAAITSAIQTAIKNRVYAEFTSRKKDA